jgi:hypothetical protein
MEYEYSHRFWERERETDMDHEPEWRQDYAPRVQESVTWAESGPSVVLSSLHSDPFVLALEMRSWISGRYFRLPHPCKHSRPLPPIGGSCYLFLFKIYASLMLRCFVRVMCPINMCSPKQNHKSATSCLIPFACCLSQSCES